MLSKIREVFPKIMNTLTLGIIELVVGIFLLISPPGLAVGILVAVGIVLLVNGVFRCIAYFREPVSEAQKSHKLMSGLLVVTCGLFFLFNSSFVVGIFPALAALYGILVMMSVFLKVEMLVSLVREKSYTWYIMTCSLFFSFMAMMILFGSPVPFVGTGILLIVVAAIDAVLFMNEKGKISVPTLKVLFQLIASRITAGRSKTETPVVTNPTEQPAEMPPVETPQKEAPASGHEEPAEQTATAETAPGEQPSEGKDPADEDMSWANVPQLEMPE